MRRLYHFMLLAAGIAAALTVGAQTNGDIDAIFSQLKNPDTADVASEQIWEMASTNVKVRGYVIQRLPDLIAGTEPAHVRLNAVELAGKLKAPEMVPSLIHALSWAPMSRDRIRTFTRYMHLDDDAVGKALAEIGDPSVPEVAKLLSSPDVGVRKRVSVILVNVNTALSRQALRDHLTIETDEHVRRLIRAQLGDK
jgi:HEAT repeat protein